VCECFMFHASVDLSRGDPTTAGLICACSLPAAEMDELEADEAARGDVPEEEDDRSSVYSSVCPHGGSPAAPKGAGAGGETPGALEKNEKPNKKTEHKRRCRLCQKWQLEENFPINSAYCRECKQAVDNLAKQATRQSQEEWWKKIRNDEPELRKLVDKYLSTCPKTHERGKRGSFNLVSYKEEYAASTTSSTKARGRMMWEEYYVEFAKKTKGGSLSEAAARARWKEMLQDPAVEKDQNGPPEAPTRCLVPMFDEVAHGSKLTHTKSQGLQTKKDQKNVSAEQAAKDRRLLLQGHERGALNKNGEAMDFMGAVSGMLANTACGLSGRLGASGSAFSGKGAFIPDIKVLKDEMEEDEAAAAEKNPAEPAASSEGTTSGKRPGEAPDTMPPPLKKARWFDVAAAHRLESQARRLGVGVACACLRPCAGDRARVRAYDHVHMCVLVCVRLCFCQLLYCVCVCVYFVWVCVWLYAPRL